MNVRNFQRREVLDAEATARQNAEQKIEESEKAVAARRAEHDSKSCIYKNRQP